MRRHAIGFGFALALALALAGCGAPSPCAVALSPDGAHDLRLVGSGSCAQTVTLALRVAVGAPDAPAWSDAASAPVVVGGAWSLAPGGVARTITVSNPGTSPLSLVGLEWSTDGGAPAADRMLHNGYQSWSYAGFESIPAALADASDPPPHGGDNEDLLGELPGVSWWWTALADAQGRGLVAGAGGGTVFKSYFAVDGRPRPRLRIVEGATGDALVLAPGETRTLDDLFVALGDVSSGLDAYATYVAARHPAPAPRSPARGGWGSWNLYYATPTADAVRMEAAWAAQTLLPLGLDDFLLDDGYEPHWGVWQASPSFGAPLATLDQEQAQAGLGPAVWMAPFYVDTTDPLVAAHPDWFVHGTDGALRTYDNFGPTYAALDVSSPGARAYVVAAVAQYRAWGYRTLKIDFLFGGAIEGVRQQPLTGLESYAQWMQALREAAPDLHLIGCGAPLLPSVGWVDSMRTGPDIAYVTSPEPRYGFIAAQARQTAMRGFTDHFWSLDPDVVLLRGDVIDDDEAWTAVVAAALAGGNYLVGDARQASAARQAMALAPELLELTRDGVAARPLDLVAQTDDQIVASPLFDPSGVTAPPHLWQKTSPDGKRRWLALFAWNDPQYRASVSLPSDTEELLPPSASSPIVTVAAIGAQSSIAVPPHAVRLFRFAPAP